MIFYKVFVFRVICEKKAKKILEDFMPDLVFATGGYVSWPVLRAADKLNIPRIIHESTATPGMTTKLLYKKCDKLLLNLMGSENNYKKKNHITVVGNPIRDEFDIITKKQAYSFLSYIPQPNLHSSVHWGAEALTFLKLTTENML